MLEHSYKGTTWKKHKYIRKENGRYYYPSKHESYEDYDRITKQVEYLKKHTLKGQSREASIGLERNVTEIREEAKRRKERGERIINSVMNRIGNQMMSKAKTKSTVVRDPQRTLFLHLNLNDPSSEWKWVH